MESEGRWLPPGVLPVGDGPFWVASRHASEWLASGLIRERLSAEEAVQTYEERVRFWSLPTEPNGHPTDTPSIPPPIGTVKA